MLKTIPIVKNNALVYVEVDLADYLYEGQPIWERIHLFEIVETLPPTGTANKIYFLENNSGGDNAYTEYVWLANKWETIGNTNIDLEEEGNLTINLSGFASKTFVNAAKEEAKAYTDSEIEKLDLSGTGTGYSDFSGDYNDLTNRPPLFSGSFNDLTDKPTIPTIPILANVATSGSFNDLTDKPTIPTLPTLATVATSGSFNDLTDKPSISTDDIDLTGYSQTGHTHSKSDITDFTHSHSYSDLTGTKPIYTASEVGALPDTTTLASLGYTEPTLSSLGGYTKTEIGDKFSATNTRFQSILNIKNALTGKGMDPTTPFEEYDDFIEGLIIGDDGRLQYPPITYDPCGIDWTLRTSADDSISWMSVCYGNGLFVAVTQNTAKVMTSPDGINWTVYPIAAAQTWRSICYGKGIFVAVAANGTDRIMTSPDGVNWTFRSATSDLILSSVCYANGIFVAVGSGTAAGSRIITSSDGVTWTSRFDATTNSLGFNSVCYGNGLFVATVTGSINTNRFYTSSDGIDWTARGVIHNIYWTSICYGNGLFLAISSGPAGLNNRVATSPDGINWTFRSIAADYSWTSICYARGLFVAVASSGTGNRVMTSGVFTPLS
ncbi:hypothetical protein AGMMS49944_24890 [Spirochaetia bacterium]|nr:hypothetical protein AGMMS49944_24890 [Spirochaetia bacterium]